MQSYADALLQSFSTMTDADFDRFEDMSEMELNLALMQSGIPVESDNFLSMINAWKAGVKECGSLVSMKDYTLKTENKSATLIAKVQFENRDGELEFMFDEKAKVESLTVNADYTTAEILKKAGLNTVLGMGTVFLVLIFISFIISLFRFIPAIEKKYSKKVEKAEAAPAISIAAAGEVQHVQNAGNDSELAAVIAAAIAASEGTSTDGFIVRSIKKRKTNKWN